MPDPSWARRTAYSLGDVSLYKKAYKTAREKYMTAQALYVKAGSELGGKNCAKRLRELGK